MWPDWLGGAYGIPSPAGTGSGVGPSQYGIPNAYPSLLNLLGTMQGNQNRTPFSAGTNPLGMGVAGLGMLQGRGLNPQLFQAVSDRNRQLFQQRYCPPQQDQNQPQSTGTNY